MPPFALLDQDGRPFGTEQLSGKLYLATFMFTRCPSICPRVTARMKEVDAAIRRADLQLELVSFSVDPEYDTPLALREYAAKHGVQAPRFHFVTGDFKQIAITAEHGFKIGLAGKAERGKPHLGITHGSHLVLVNQRGSIVGYFPSSEAASVAQIVATVRALSST